MFSKIWTTKSTGVFSAQAEQLRQLLADADAKAVLSAALPGMLDGPAAAFLANKSFNDLKGMMPGGEALFAQLLTKLNQLS